LKDDKPTGNRKPSRNSSIFCFQNKETNKQIVPMHEDLSTKLPRFVQNALSKWKNMIKK